MENNPLMFETTRYWSNNQLATNHQLAVPNPIKFRDEINPIRSNLKVVTQMVHVPWIGLRGNLSLG